MTFLTGLFLSVDLRGNHSPDGLYLLLGFLNKCLLSLMTNGETKLILARNMDLKEVSLANFPWM